MTPTKTEEINIFFQIAIILTSIALLSLSVHLAFRGDFLINLITHGGPDEAWLNAALIFFGFVGGVILLVRHLLEYGVGELFYEYPPL